MLLPFALFVLLLQAPATQLPDAPTQTGAQPVGDRIYPGNELDVHPKLISAADPEFTEMARKKRIHGNVSVAFILDKDGVPTDVRLVKGVGHGLDEKAMDAVRRYKFTPGMKDGVTVRTTMTCDVNFQIF